jgi:hypothetical protein
MVTRSCAFQIYYLTVTLFVCECVLSIIVYKHMSTHTVVLPRVEVG